MVITANQTCSHCGYENAAQTAACGLCGELLSPVHPGRLQATVQEPRPVAPDLDSMLSVTPGALSTPSDSTRYAGDVQSPSTLWLYLAAGLVLSQAFQLTHITSFMAWFLSALPHEMGHSLFACYVGMPAWPAISLAGHAAAFHQAQVLPLAILIWAALAGATYAMRTHRRARILLGLAVLTYPMLAFFATPRELMHLLGGHLGELAFATVCFWRTLSGGFSKSRAERLLYAVLAWHLLVQNAWMCWHLMTDAASRSAYRSNGSFGLTNDYIRVAEDVLAWSLPSVAALMLVVSLCVLPVSWLVWRLYPEH